MLDFNEFCHAGLFEKLIYFSLKIKIKLTYASLNLIHIDSNVRLSEDLEA